MAGALKQEFIEAVRLTPDGIADFLETPLPAAPTIGTPADKDSAIIASGVLSKYLLDVFGAFAGLTPVELLLRIGQHNSVLESAMIAGLEYIEGSDSDENSIEIIQPGEGIDYAPGEMRFAAIVANGECSGVTLTLGQNDPVLMYLVGEKWLQYVDMTAGEYSATMTATFEDQSTSNSTVNFTVADTEQEPPPETPPEPPGGNDDEALKRAQANVKKAYRDLIGALTGLGDVDNPPTLPEELAAYQNATTLATAFVGAVNTFLRYAPSNTQDLVGSVQSLLSTLSPVVWSNVDLVINNSTTVMNMVDRIASL